MCGIARTSVSSFSIAFERLFKTHPPNYLASIEVIYCVGRILGKEEYLRVIDEYYFAEEFLELNGFER